MQVGYVAVKGHLKVSISLSSDCMTKGSEEAQKPFELLKRKKLALVTGL